MVGAQADLYTDGLTRVLETIAALPTLARERTEFDPPVRIHAHESHLIGYLLCGDDLIILRLLGGRQDWRSILRAADS